MKKLFNLFLILLKNSSFLLNSGTNKKRDAFVAILIFFSIIPFIFGIVQFTVFALNLLTGNEAVLLNIATLIYSVLIFIVGLFYVINILYFSKDIEYLLPLPLKSHEIVGAKLLVCLVYEYLTGSFLFLPFLITYGVKTSAGFLFYFYSSIIYLFVPVIPVILVSLISMSIMSFIPFSKNKDMFRFAASLFAIIFALGINFYMQSIGNNIDKNAVTLSYIKHNSTELIEQSSKFYPILKFSSLSLYMHNNLNGLYNLINYILINLVMVVIYLSIGSALYLKGATSESEVSSKKRDKNIKVIFNRRSIITSLIKKELLILLRTPAYFMNCILINFLWPIFIVYYIGQPSSIFSKLNMPANSFLSSNYSIIGVLIGISVASMTSVASTSISREGTAIDIIKFLPIDYFKYILSKIYTSFIISGLGALLIYLTFIIVWNLNIFYSVISILIAMNSIILATCIGLLLDMKFPKLIWENEYKAVKQNTNVLINLGLNGIILIGLYYLFTSINNIYLKHFLIILLPIATVYLLLKFLKRNSTKIIEDIVY